MYSKTTSEKTTVYAVATPVYEGPLDLLLQLIEHSELDVTKLSLSQVTDQFLDYMKIVEEHSPVEVSSFLMIASRLMQIKSESLLPRPPEREPGEEDPGEALIQKLLTYRRYKEIAETLGKREEIRSHTYLRLASPIKVEGKIDFSGVVIKDLANAAMQAFARTYENIPLGKVIILPKISIREKISLITQSLRANKRTSFQILVADSKSRTEIVITFLALLELIKRFLVSAEQTTRFGDIEVTLLEDIDKSSEFALEFSE